VVTDATHVVLTNSGTTGNATAGTVIGSSAQVSPAGSIGPTGATGSGGSGGVTPNHTQATRSSAWTYADGTVIPWTGTNWDTDSKWASGNPSRLTIVTAGYYLVTVQLNWSPNAGTGVLNVNISVNGSTHPKLGNAWSLPSGANPGNQIISGVLKLNAGDYVEVIPWSQVAPAPVSLAVPASASSPAGPIFQLDYLGT
jgi:hypothetical protein